MTRAIAAIQFPLRVRCLFCFASATIIIVDVFVRSVFLIVWFGRQDRTDHSRVGRLKEDEEKSKQPLNVCIAMVMAFVRPARQTPDTWTHNLLTFLLLYVLCVGRRRTCNDIRIIFVVTWLVLEWTKVQYFVGTQCRNPLINFCNIVWWCVGRLWACVSRWSNNRVKWELWHIEHKSFEIETTWNFIFIWQGRPHLNWSGSQVFFDFAFSLLTIFLSRGVVPNNLHSSLSRKRMSFVAVVKDELPMVEIVQNQVSYWSFSSL